MSEGSLFKFINFILNEYQPDPYQEISDIIKKGLGFDKIESNNCKAKTANKKEKYYFSFHRSKTPGSLTNKNIKLIYHRNPNPCNKLPQESKNLNEVHNIPLLKYEPNRLSVVLSSYIKNNSLQDYGKRKFIHILDSGENARMRKCHIKKKIGLETIMVFFK